jgi:hypothetical protein
MAQALLGFFLPLWYTFNHMELRSMTRREWGRSMLATLSVAAPAQQLRVAAFRADATPPLGEPLIWVDPAKEVLDPLWAKGVILDDGHQRIVLCAIDWCGIGSSTHRLFKRRIAEAASTKTSNVSVHAVHQHTAPYVDGDGASLLRKFPETPLLMSGKALDLVTARIAEAAGSAAGRLQPVGRIGYGEAEVESVASARRIIEAGSLVIRYSTSGRDPKMAALPEGDIDRRLRTLTFEHGGKPLVRLHYYATHPQTFCCDGRITADFVGAAREQFEKEEGVPQVYFTGCAGDVTVGKYNDSSPAARDGLRRRLLAGLRASAAATGYSEAPPLYWRTARVIPPPRGAPLPDLAAMSGRPAQDRYRAAITIAFSRRKEPLEIAALHLGAFAVLHLPGEPMLFFQQFAMQAAPGKTVMAVGYGDISPGYLCTDEAFLQGGYEPSASNAGASMETVLTRAIKEVLVT